MLLSTVSLLTEALLQTQKIKRIADIHNATITKTYYVSAQNVNVRDINDTNIIITQKDLNNEVSVLSYQDSQDKLIVKVDNKLGYIAKQYVSNNKIVINNPNINITKTCSGTKPAPSTSGGKSYMPYTAITSTDSPQYKLQCQAHTGNYGIRMVGDRYCVALGSYYTTTIGQKFDLVLENGTVIPCVLSDIKADEHTLCDNVTTANNGCVSEFIVDINHLKKDIKTHGDISYAEGTWDSPVVMIRVYGKNIITSEVKQNNEN